jgi:hypothetical protein
MACTNGAFAVPSTVCSKDDAKTGTGIRIENHGVAKYNGTYVHQISNTGEVSWVKGDCKIVPVSANKLSLYSDSATALVTLNVDASNKITIAGSQATVTYGKLKSPSVPNGGPGACVNMMPGDECINFTCAKDYVTNNGKFKYDGDTFTTSGACVRSTEQKPQGTCTKINPVGLSFPSGSACTVGGDMTGGSTCSFTCSPGYLLSGPASANAELTCKDGALSQSRACLTLPSGIFVRTTGPEGGHYIFDNISTWYKDGDKASYAIAPKSPTEPGVLELRASGGGAGAPAMYTMTIGTAAGTGTEVASISPALTVTGPGSTTAEFVCGPWDKPECTGFSKETATKAKRTAASASAASTASTASSASSASSASAASSTGTRSIATFYPTALPPWKVLLFKQSDASWAGTSMDERYVSLAGTKVTIVTATAAVEYAATSAGAKSYILTPASSEPMIVTFDLDPIVTPAPSPSPSTFPSPSPSTGLSTEAIIGIAVGSAVALFLFIGLFVRYVRNKRRDRAQ